MKKKGWNTFLNEVLRRKSGSKKTGIKKKLHEEALWSVLFVFCSYVFKTHLKPTGPCDGNRKNGKCVQVILMGKLI
jgi:hypothetical protein